jgi:hypothetical protein
MYFYAMRYMVITQYAVINHMSVPEEITPFKSLSVSALSDTPVPLAAPSGPTTPTPVPSAVTTARTPRPSSLINIGTSHNISHLNYQNNEDLSWFYQPAGGTLLYHVHFNVSQMELNYDYLLFGPYGTSDVRTQCTGFNICSDAYISSSTGVGFSFHSDLSTRQ